jgi:hypothetical protein
MIGARFAAKVPEALKSVWSHTMELLGDLGHVELVSIHLETFLVSVQDRCTVYAKRTIGSEIIFDAPDGTPRLRG